MRLLRHGELIVATYVSGPLANFLGLDFTVDRRPYERDLAGKESVERVSLDDVKEQVAQAQLEHRTKGGASRRIAGILYLSSDTPSESAYRSTALKILTSLPNIDDLDTFEPTWCAN